jgi:hypothetical protein
MFLLVRHIPLLTLDSSLAQDDLEERDYWSLTTLPMAHLAQVGLFGGDDFFVTYT